MYLYYISYVNIYFTILESETTLFDPGHVNMYTSLHDHCDATGFYTDLFHDYTALLRMLLSIKLFTFGRLFFCWFHLKIRSKII